MENSTMNDNLNFTLKKSSALIATGFSLFLLVYGVRHRNKIMERLRFVYTSRYPLRHKRIQIIETHDDVQRSVNVLKMHTASYKVIGFDCEWVQVEGKRRPIALLQLASLQGYCALFRLCKLGQVPKSLRELLNDENLIKVGVSSKDDAQKLLFDYGVDVTGTFDLRFLAAMAGYEPNGLAKLSKALLDVDLDKNWRLSCSNWEALQLSTKQGDYAANDALVAIEIFFKLSRIIEPRTLNLLSSNFLNFEHVKEKIKFYYDLGYKRTYYVPTLVESKVPPVANIANPSKKPSDGKEKKQEKNNVQKPFYHNCLLQAPDGDLLCTIDQRKATWYTRNNLGHVVCENPFTVRLNFEPSGRAVGEVGRFYQTPKEDQCVVCGRKDALTRKNVVPRDYRKHFPEVMKSKTSHDILLLCPSCHNLTDMSNIPIREKLAILCNAPINYHEGAVKYNENPELRKVRSAARALVSNGPKIPQPKRDELRTIITNHYQVDELTDEILQQAFDLESRSLNEDYTEHGLKVVQKYETELGGLVELERLWREHFLNTMQPKFLPALWNVNHNVDRLEIRAREGRVSQEELRSAGIKITVTNPKPQKAIRRPLVPRVPEEINN